MPAPSQPNQSDLPLIDSDVEATYSIDMVARLCDMTTETILVYHERGLLPSARQQEGGRPCFDDEAVRRLRRLESLRQSGAMNWSGLCLVSDLLDEVERLRDALRRGP